MLYINLVILCLIAGSSNTGKNYMNSLIFRWKHHLYPLTLSIILFIRTNNYTCSDFKNTSTPPSLSSHTGKEGHLFDSTEKEGATPRSHAGKEGSRASFCLCEEGIRRDFFLF
jgi:hypothetical protein